MSWVPFAWAVALLLVIHAMRRVMGSRAASRASYTRQDFLLSPEERQFFSALRKAVGEDYVIFGKIRVADVITPRSVSNVDAAWSALEALGQNHFPFVLCKQSDLSIACALQLIQHTLPGQRVHTATHPLKTICLAAGLPLVRLEAGPFYDHHDIRQAVFEAVRKEPLFISETDGRKEPTIDALEKLEL